MTSFKLWTTVVLAILLVLFVSAHDPVQADDEHPYASHIEVRVDLDAYRSGVPVTSPQLVLPSDVEVAFWPWAAAEMGEGEAMFQFEEREFEGYVVPPEEVVEFLYELLSEHFDGDMLSAEFREGEGIYLRGKPASVRLAEDALRWLLAGIAPHLDVTATMTGERQGTRVLAAGHQRLRSGNWTRLFLQHRETSVVADWEIEIAQETTAMVPVVAQIPEGQELYLRYHPGESVSLVEVWAGHLEHLEMRNLDLSVIRNVPESSGPGRITLPQTAGYRAYTVLSVPADRATKKEILWHGPAGPVWLALEFDAASPRQDLRRNTRRNTELFDQVFRVGALAAGLEFERRLDSSEHLCDRLRIADEENSYATYSGSRLRFGGDEKAALRIGERIRAYESRLQTHQIRLRTLTVGDGALVDLLAPGKRAIGYPIDSDRVQALADREGSVLTGEIVMPVLEGIEVSYRVGTSVTGLARFDVEVAQQSGGMDPSVGARFAGVHGTLRVFPDGSDLRLAVNTRLGWATPEGSMVSLTFRPPVGMKTDLQSYPAPGPNDTVQLPVLGGGGSRITSSVALPADGREVLIGVTPKGTEAVLLLARREHP